MVLNLLSGTVRGNCIWFYLTYKVAKGIFFWPFLAFPKKFSEKDKNYFIVAAVHDLVEEKSDREQ